MLTYAMCLKETSQEVVNEKISRHILLPGSNNPAGNCMFKVNNENTRARYEISSKLTIKTSK